MKLQFPAGIDVRPGTPLSVAKVATTTVAFAAIVVVTLCSAAPEGVGDHCLYVGVPNALLVLRE